MERRSGKVTKLVPYGAFVELEKGVEGLIHVSELSWVKRIARPSDVLSTRSGSQGVVSASARKSRRSPSACASSKPIHGTRSTPASRSAADQGQIRNLTAYGAFVELEEGIDGMIHVSDLSWTRKINHPSEMLKKGDDVEAVRPRNRQGQPAHQPRHQAARLRSLVHHRRRFKVGDLVKGTVAKIASFGAFIQLEDDIDGLVHISSSAKTTSAASRTCIKVGEEVEARVIKVDKVERRIGLSDQGRQYSEEQLKQGNAPPSKPSVPAPTSSGWSMAFNLATEEWRPSENK
jgi:small subunit ribosomal protein S1